ncbi:MAG: NAD-dependent epimerase/dehydratase family protein [Promethearchaeota archaeon]
MKNRRILITGSRGYIGQNLIKILDREKVSWIGLDNKDGQDILNPESFPSENFDDIIHLAGISDRNYSIHHPDIVLKTNILSTLNVLENARKNGSRVIFISSSLVYKPKTNKISENDPLNPVDPYSFSKKMCEDLSIFYQVNFKIPIVIIRLFNVYGKKLKENTLFYDLIEQILNKNVEKIKILNNSSSRDYVHISDVINGILLILNSKDTGIFNLGSGRGYRPKQIANLIMDVEGYRKEIEISNKGFLNEGWCSNNSKIERIYNYHPKISILDGIKELLHIYSKREKF